ncbi:hypothetical protein [Xanthomonas translucens]|uniref:hypothetical protein n=1 Tax=Xanthomonas campestris pv. translucens TaxID=343 RepID=UPI0011B2797D|nr:hypothetical protein [Xanthomonas translucens]
MKMNHGKLKSTLTAVAIAWLFFSIYFSAAVNVLYLGGSLPSWIVFFSKISSRAGFSEKSGIGCIADVYYSLVLLVCPLIATIAYLAVIYDGKGQYSEWAVRSRTLSQKIASVVLGVVCVFISLSAIAAFAGQGNRFLYIAKDFWSMAIKGWIPFAVFGALIGVGLSFIKIGSTKNKY